MQGHRIGQEQGGSVGKKNVIMVFIAKKVRQGKQV